MLSISSTHGAKPRGVRWLMYWVEPGDGNGALGGEGNENLYVRDHLLLGLSAHESFLL